MGQMSARVGGGTGVMRERGKPRRELEAPWPEYGNGIWGKAKREGGEGRGNGNVVRGAMWGYGAGEAKGKTWGQVRSGRRGEGAGDGRNVLW